MRKIKSFKLFESKEEIDEDVQYIMSAVSDLSDHGCQVLKYSEDHLNKFSLFIEIISPNGRFSVREEMLKFYTLIRNKLSQLNGMALEGEIDYDISLKYETLSPNKERETKDLDLKEIFNLINNESNNVLSRCTIVFRHK